MVATIVIIWLQGLNEERSIWRNGQYSTALLAVFFFLFLTIGLYNGFKLRDNLGKIIDKFRWKKPDIDLDISSGDLPDLGDGIGGIIMGIIMWIIFSIALVVLIWIFGAVFWFSILLLMALLYWIFFRALRLVFKKSKECKGNLSSSILYGAGYTLLYSGWLFVILFIAEHRENSLTVFQNLFN